MNQNTISPTPDSLPVNTDQQVPEAPLHNTLEPLVKPAGGNRSKILVVAALTVLAAAGLTGAYTLLTKSPDTTPEPVAVLPTPKAIFLSVANLKEQMPAVNGELIVKGTTLPNTTVLIYSDSDETSTESDSAGNFEETILVDEESGLVRVVAYSEDGQEMSSTFSATDSSESPVLGRSDEKKGAADKTTGKIKNAKAEEAEMYIQKTAEKSSKASPAAQSTKASPSPVKTKAEAKKEMTAFLAAKKTVKKEEKLGAKQLLKLASTEGTESSASAKKMKVVKMLAKQATSGAVLKRHAVSGVITAVSQDSLTIAHQVQRDRTYTVYFNINTTVALKGVAGATTADLKVGMRVAVAGIPNENGLLANRIHVIPGKATGLLSKNPIASDSATPKASATATASASPSSSPTVKPSASASASATPKASVTPEPTATE